MAKKTAPIVKVYSTPGCPYCFTLKEFLKEKGIEFEDINVLEDENAKEYMIEKSKQMGIPVVEIGDKMIAGFDRAEIMKLLGLKD